MKPLIVALLVIALAASVARAGELYGSISEGNKPVAAGIKLVITANGKTYSAETDKFGAYRVFVKEKGKCSLTVSFKDQSTSVDVFSYEKSTRYDWILESKDGKLTLGRK